MGKNRPPKTPPEEWARQEANAARLRELCERALKELGMTREELFAKVGLTDPHQRTA
jgi:uncharacterized protein YjiS (DUF1127 family)